MVLISYSDREEAEQIETRQAVDAAMDNAETAAKVDIAKACSPPWMTAAPCKLGLRAGPALDPKWLMTKSSAIFQSPKCARVLLISCGLKSHGCS